MTAKRIRQIIFFLIIGFFFFLIFKDGDSNKNPNGTPKTERQIQLEKQFNAWDGSHINMTKLIKSAMHDPNSFKHIETIYWDMKDYVVVRTTYGGKNAFGATVRNSVKAKFDNNGNLLEIIEEGINN